MKGKIFNAQEVQSILNGSKVMFRVVVKPYPWQVVINADFKKGNNIPKYGHAEREIRPKFQVGEEIKPTNQSIHLQLKLFNITLRIKSVKVERLQDISEKDAVKEGISERNIEQDFPAVEYFKEEWNSTHKKPEEKWEANPWVWKVQFELIK